MNTVKITVDSQAAQKPMRDILGMNNIPPDQFCQDKGI